MKKRKFNKSEISGLPNDKPSVYQIKSAGNQVNYIGSAKRGRLRERLNEHLGNIPGASVSISQFTNIEEAQANESKMIKSTKPKYNRKGK